MFMALARNAAISAALKPASKLLALIREGKKLRSSIAATTLGGNGGSLWCPAMTRHGMYKAEIFWIMVRRIVARKYVE